MPAKTPFVLRYRLMLSAVLLFLGFDAPWARYFGQDRSLSTLWIQLSALIARTGLLNLQSATVLVTAAAIFSACLAAWLRVWATAYVGAGVMSAGLLRADSVLAAGPYRYVRNPLYLGTLFASAATSILMPVSGAVAFLAGHLLLTWCLASAEGDHLEMEMGHPYRAYRAAVPAFIPAVRTHVLSSSARPHWPRAVAAQSFHLGFALCLLVFGWQYNVDLLIRCLLICFGLSLVVNGAVANKGPKLAVQHPE